MNSKIKKITALFIILCVTACLFAEVKVVSVTGKCEYENNGVWNPVTVGQILSEGTKIQTGFKSEMVLSLISNNENSKLTVAQLSRMTIDQLISSDKMDKTNISLTTGSVKSEINKTGNVKVNFTIKSPVATASVRGTVTEYTNTVQAVEVQTERGWTAVWPTVMNNDVNIDSQDEIEFPENVVNVKKAQETIITESNKITEPQEVAHGKATGREDVKTAVELENEYYGEQSGSVTTNTTGIKVSVEWN